MASPLKLGDLVLGPDGVKFDPVPGALLQLASGEKAEVGVAYKYHEPTKHRDETTLQLTVEVDGRRLGTASVAMRDVPMQTDERWGFLAVPVVHNGSPRSHGRFRIEGRHTAKPWMGGDQKVLTIRHEGEFEINSG